MTTPFSGGLYGSGVSRSSTQPDALVPQPYVDEVIKNLPQYSTVLKMANVKPMTALTERQPVLTGKPVARWTNATSTPGGGDYGLVTTSQATWGNLVLVAEEISTTIPIPRAYFDDAAFDVWGEIKPEVTESIGKAIDAAVLFGVNMPTSWGTTSVYGGANSVGNVIQSSAFTVSGDTPTLDYALGFAKAGALLGAEGFSLNGSCAAPGFGFALSAIRGSTGLQLYPNAAEADITGNLFGYKYTEVKNGSWNAAQSSLIVGDWSKAIVGLRQDMEFQIFDTGVIQDDTGAIVFNLLQESLFALKCTARIGFVTANPVTALTSTHGVSFPFAVVQGSSALT